MIAGLNDIAQSREALKETHASVPFSRISSGSKQLPGSDVCQTSTSLDVKPPGAGHYTRTALTIAEKKVIAG